MKGYGFFSRRLWSRFRLDGCVVTNHRAHHYAGIGDHQSDDLFCRRMVSSLRLYIARLVVKSPSRRSRRSIIPCSSTSIPCLILELIVTNHRMQVRLENTTRAQAAGLLVRCWCFGECECFAPHYRNDRDQISDGPSIDHFHHRHDQAIVSRQLQRGLSYVPFLLLLILYLFQFEFLPLADSYANSHPRIDGN